MKIIRISVPTGWHELSQKQLRFLLSAIHKVNARASGGEMVEVIASQVRTLCLFEWGGLKPVCPFGDGWLLRHEATEFYLSSEVIADAASRLSWISSVPSEPVRLDTVDGAEAVAADLSGFSFDSWLACESIWQQYQAGNDDEYLRRMAEILYCKEDIVLDGAERVGIFYWWASVKNMVSAMFPNFFKPIGPGTDSETPSFDEMRRNVDAQIRALTKGDVTKESEILSLDAIRALTELDAQAREYDEINRKYPSK